MTRILAFAPSSRLLVFAPHPDDETIATGGLIQLAIAAGAAVRVVFATDGDNNPWPQRWIERRWHLGPADRARWGNRRRLEAQAALARLGVTPESARFLGWPDLGLTEKLERDDSAIDTLAAEICTFAPTHVVMPSLRDRHPDHGALHVMLELALGKAETPCIGLGYVVHGRTGNPGEWLLPRDAERQHRKRDALMAHTSQIRLSGSRLLRWISQQESFEQVESRGSLAAWTPAGSVLRIPLDPPYRFLRQHEILLVLVDGDRIERARVRLPRLIRAGARQTLGTGLCSGRVSVELDGDGVKLIFAAGGIAHGASGYVKLERSAPRLLIFDTETWHRFEDFPMPDESVTTRVEPVVVAQRASL